METYVNCCPVCLQDVPLTKVLFYECGHKICTGCYETVIRDPKMKNECVHSRCPLTVPPHRIYITLEDLYQKDVSVLSEGPRKKGIIEKLYSINQNTPAISLEKASKKIMSLREAQGNDPATDKALLAAIKNLEERIAPMFKRLAEVESKNIELREINASLQDSKAQHMDKLKQTELVVENEKKESKRLRERAERYRLMILEHNTNSKQAQDKLMSKLDARDKKINLLKMKLTALTKSQKRKPRPSTDLDVSLQIEPPPHHDADPIIRPAKRRKSSSFTDQVTL